MMRRWKPRILLVSIANCVFVGIPVTTFFLGVNSGDPLLPLNVDLAGVPFLWYAFIVGVPFALVAAALGYGGVLGLLRWKRCVATWRGWVLACVALGTLTAAAVSVLIWTLGLVVAPGFSTLVGVVPSGAICGGLLGVYSWRAATSPSTQ